MLGLGCLGCQAAGIRANATSASPAIPGPPQIQQSLSFLGIGSAEMASESYRGVSSMGYFSQGASENTSFLMLGPSIAVEASLAALVEEAP